MAIDQLQHHRCDALPAKEHWRSDAQPPGRLAATGLERCLRRAEFSHYAAALLIVRMPFVSQAQMARGSLQQPHSETLLKPADDLRYSGARDAKAFARCGEAAGIHYVHKLGHAS
jgi:hypothetical protein